MTNYDIILTEDSNLSSARDQMTKLIKQYIQLGWIPCGGISLSTSKHYNEEFYILAQAIVEKK